MPVAMVAVRLSMSMAPRPHTTPSISSPPKGSCRQSSLLAGTTSVCPNQVSEGAVGSEPWILATRDVRPGSGSKVSMSTPEPSR
jgi:hypothetical protein